MPNWYKKAQQPSKFTVVNINCVVESKNEMAQSQLIKYLSYVKDFSGPRCSLIILDTENAGENTEGGRSHGKPVMRTYVHTAAMVVDRSDSTDCGQLITQALLQALKGKVEVVNILTGGSWCAEMNRERMNDRKFEKNMQFQPGTMGRLMSMLSQSEFAM